MSELIHDGKVIQKTNESWQTQARGSSRSEYEIYVRFGKGGKGGDITNPGCALKSFDEWLSS